MQVLVSYGEYDSRRELRADLDGNIERSQQTITKLIDILKDDKLAGKKGVTIRKVDDF